MNAIERLRELGQSVWLDFLDHEILASGRLDAMIGHESLGGMTSNPTILQKAIAGSSAYDRLISRADLEPRAVFEQLVVGDIRNACDKFRILYERSDGRDGFVSVEVSPDAARDADRSVEEAHRLWSTVDRPNVLVKIPGTVEGISAISRCLEAGININITLLFSVSRYLEVAEAYVRALEARVARKQAVDRIASVASFFVSRVDKRIDKVLSSVPNALAGLGASLRGQIGIANAKIAYEEYERLVSGPRFGALAEKGARPQRLLWASTSTKDPAYPDVYYVEALIGKDTINTMPLETFRAYADHGKPELRLSRDRALAHKRMLDLKPLGIDFERESGALEEEGIAAFSESFAKALRDIADKRRKLQAA